LFVLHSDEQLLRALESKQYGRPLALGAVVREAIAAKDLIPLSQFLAAKDSIYHRSWSVWNLAAWTMKQLGVADMLKSDRLQPGQFVVVANVEEAGKAFGERNGAAAATHSRLERTFSKSHFYRTFNDQLLDGKQISETDMEVLLKFLSRDKGLILYDGSTVKIKAPGVQEAAAITDEDVSIAQLKELLASLTHQTVLLGKRLEELTATAKQAVAKNNRVAAMAALKSRKLTESTLERRFATVNQLEEVAAKIEQASDNVQLVRVMESSGEALRSLYAQTGGVERVDEVVGRLREQMAATDEVGSILAESAGTEVVDEAEIEDEMAALELEERRKVEEAERAVREAEQAREAEETRRRLEAVEKVPADVQPSGGEREKGKEKEQAPETKTEIEDMMSTMSLEERPEVQAS
jgi:charged multivesicular body protein 7